MTSRPSYTTMTEVGQYDANAPDFTLPDIATGTWEYNVKLFMNEKPEDLDITLELPETYRDPPPDHRTASTIYFEINEDGDPEIVEFTPGAATYEDQAGVLADAVQRLMRPRILKPGWYVMEGFKVEYSYGSYDDANPYYHHDGIRLAEKPDFPHFREETPIQSQGE